MGALVNEGMKYLERSLGLARELKARLTQGS